MVHQQEGVGDLRLVCMTWGECRFQLTIDAGCPLVRQVLFLPSLIDVIFLSAAWIVLFILTTLVFRRERRREPSFNPPTSPHADDRTSYGNVFGSDGERDAEKPEPESYFPSYEAPSVTHGHNRSDGKIEAQSGARTSGYSESMDGRLIGLPASRGSEEPSRTMQLAFNDPCGSLS